MPTLMVGGTQDALVPAKVLRAVAAEVPKGRAPQPRAGDFLSARLARRTEKVAIETVPEGRE